MQSNAALLIIDTQLGMFEEGNPVYRSDELLATINDLIARARDAGVPVIYVQHSGGDGHLLEPGSPGWPIHPAIAPAKGELVIHKHHPDSFQETRLQHELEVRKIRQLIVAGIQTEYCVDTTCRRAYSLSYDVILLQDAHSTWDTEHLKASQIIDHHNQVLGGWFATLKEAHRIEFDRAHTNVQLAQTRLGGWNTLCRSKHHKELTAPLEKGEKDARSTSSF